MGYIIGSQCRSKTRRLQSLLNILSNLLKYDMGSSLHLSNYLIRTSAHSEPIAVLYTDSVYILEHMYRPTEGHSI